ncbi:TetR/AcrR family transcriptional regulator [Rhodococcus sp. BP-149]|nr:TetR/AcrR family transcriptional regulator [Rhodococcus sp. BP-288]MBY6693714.1 TetR/AcrR family transcriptional regulator [Rhodococcus sp. BP-188]MBY6699689.1 TetR/AcrR family transcriptional regulator [Rhodococcus sp. BP-285]MBY6703966.1 TetR/AcrR family transcriptional regulator [Rhodococcus sp. BP-283]MBY6710886.1 TetR/AcrR family transcriptional regulator [Rhodococcus sp. BP-160]MBY6715879.1 TetR/AcrR family transcriptional regulator [Rhodococcus sp. BP-110]MBY6720423.1 TetR/AcrR fami
MLWYGSVVPRPRLHDLDALMDAAESLAVDSGASAVTIRAMSERTSISNGAIYHAFGSRAGLLGRVWVRDARRMLTLQNDAVTTALEHRPGRDSAVRAVVAAADAPAAFLAESPVAARFLMTVSRRELLGTDDLPDEVAADLRTLDETLAALLVQLSRALWNRADRESVAVVKDCVVGLPTALLLRGTTSPDIAARERLAAAVRGILALPPPTTDHAPPRRKASS